MHATHVNDASAELGGELAGVLRGPDAVIAAIPYLLGFHPQDSIVIVWMRERRICLTQRMDLASDGIGEGLAVNAVAMIAANAQATASAPSMSQPGVVPPVPGPPVPPAGQVQTPGQEQMPPPRVIRRRAIVPAAPSAP